MTDELMKVIGIQAVFNPLFRFDKKKKTITYKGRTVYYVHISN